jgi:hypothetical protein
MPRPDDKTRKGRKPKAFGRLLRTVVVSSVNRQPQDSDERAATGGDGPTQRVEDAVLGGGHSSKSIKDE